MVLLKGPREALFLMREVPLQELKVRGLWTSHPLRFQKADLLAFRNLSRMLESIR